MVRLLLAVLVLLTSAGVAGCGSAGASALPGRGGAVPGAAELARRWVPADGAGAANPRPPFVALSPGGQWVGSDGCNGLRGTWSVGRDGALHATQGPSTKIGCDNVPVGLWLARASKVTLDGEVLVLLDAAGAETGRLRPA